MEGHSPAPDDPIFASITMCSFSTMPVLTSGASPSIDAVAIHPGTATSLALRMSSLCISGRPYTVFYSTSGFSCFLLLYSDFASGFLLVYYRFGYLVLYPTVLRYCVESIAFRC